MSYLYVFDPIIRNAFLKNLETELQKSFLSLMKPIICLKQPLTSQAAAYRFLVKQAELEANKFGNKEVEAFAHFFRIEVEKLTDHINREKIISPNEIIESYSKKRKHRDPREFFERMCEVGNAIKKSLLAEGKNPRSYIHAMGDFMLKWLDTADDDSYINVASRYLTKKKTKRQSWK